MNRIVIDWLTLVSVVDSPETMMEMFGFSDLPFTVMPGWFCYPLRLNYENINILYGGKDEMGVCMLLTGQGCRMFESIGHGDYERIFRDVISRPNEIWLTRLDLAYDDFDGLEIDEVYRDTENGNYVSRFKSFKCEHSNIGKSITFGSRSSLVCLRIYDKLSEQNAKVYKTIERPEGIIRWVRVELQFNKERSMELLEAYAVTDFKDLYIIFFGVLAQYHRFVSSSLFDSNKRRQYTAPYWESFYDRENRIKLYHADDTPYNLERVKDYVMRQAIGSVKSLLEIWGSEDLLTVLKNAPWPRNPKYKNLVHKEKMKEAVK